MVQITRFERCFVDMRPVVNTPSTTGKPPVGKRLYKFRRPPIDPPLDFLRALRIKTLRKFMECSFLHLLHGVLSVGLVLLVTGCGEDPRFSANTQYLGGGYGGARLVHRAIPSRIGTAITPAEVPPLRSASANSAPIFTRAACSSVFHNCPLAARDLTLRLAIIRSFKRIRTTSPLCSEITWTRPAKWSSPTST